MTTQVNDFTVACRIENYHLRFHRPDYYLDSVDYLMDTMEQTKWTLNLIPAIQKKRHPSASEDSEKTRVQMHYLWTTNSLSSNQMGHGQI
ncbi:hypothetical protein CEXT_283151 [Caerostris extrusa]|uniref:Uncharacterized protein n=1 Tax=Caerostris extrusa TaxID=172846 RepID=A0AAV4UTZ7_CAEEX|nr:hypothetical protein CEXT_283151 [Caerostris extrusa]